MMRATLEAIVEPVQADRTRNEKAVKPQLLFRRRQRTNERVDHIVARAFPFHKCGRFVGKEHLAQGKPCTRATRIRESIRQTEVIDNMPGGAPLLRQFHVNAHGAKPRIPAQINHNQDAQRPWRQRQSLCPHCFTLIQNLCLTGLT